MQRCVAVTLAFGVFVATTARAQTPPVSKPPADGAVLARTIESTDEAAKRAELSAAAAYLSPPEKARFVEWADARQADGGWSHLGPALAALDTPQAAATLAKAAREAVEREDGRRSRTLIEALGQVRPAHAFDLLWEPWLEQEALYGAAFAASLGRDPGLGVRRLAERLEQRERDEAQGPEDERSSAEQQEAFAQRVVHLVGTAVGTASDPSAFASLDLAALPAPIAAGIARGVGQRIPTRETLLEAARAEAAPAQASAREAEEGEAEAEPAADVGPVEYSSEQQAERALFERALLVLAQRGEPEVFVEVCASAPLVLDALTEDWAAALIPNLELSEHLPRFREVRDAAFACLRAVTGQTHLTQTRAAWSQWWSGLSKEERRED